MTQHATDAAPTVSVIIAAFSDERWPDLIEAELSPRTWCTNGLSTSVS
jgi:hypothetical protein